MRSRIFALVVALFVLLGSQPALGQVPSGSTDQEATVGGLPAPPPSDDYSQPPPDEGGAPEPAPSETPEASGETASAPTDARYAPPTSQPEPAPSEPAPSKPAVPSEPLPPEAASSEPASTPEPPPEPGVVPGEGGAAQTTGDDQYAGADSSPREAVVAPSYASGCGDGPQCPDPAPQEGSQPSDGTTVEDPCGPSGCGESVDPGAGDPACEQYGCEAPGQNGDDEDCEQYGCDQYVGGVTDPTDAPPQYGGEAPLPPDDGGGFGDGGGSGLPPGEDPPGDEPPVSETEPSPEEPADYPIAGYPYEGVPCGEDNCGAPLDDPTLECATFTTASGQPVVGCSSPEYYADEGCVFVDFYDENGAAYAYVESCDGAPVEPPEPPTRPSSVPDNYECGVVSGTSLGDVQVCYDPAAAAESYCPAVELYDAQGNFLGTTEDCADGGGLFYECGPDNCGAQEVPPGYTCQKVGPNPLWGDPADGSTEIYCSPPADSTAEPTEDGSCFDLIYDEQGMLLEKHPCDPQTEGAGRGAAENNEDAIAALNPGAGTEEAENPSAPTFSGGEDPPEVGGAGGPRPGDEDPRPETGERPSTDAGAAPPAAPPFDADGSGSPETPIALSAPEGGEDGGSSDNGKASGGAPFGERGAYGGGNAYLGRYGPLFPAPTTLLTTLGGPTGPERSPLSAAPARVFDLGGFEVTEAAYWSGAGSARSSSTAEEDRGEGRVPRAPSATPVPNAPGAGDAGAERSAPQRAAPQRAVEEREGKPRPLDPPDEGRPLAAAGPPQAPPAPAEVGPVEKRSGFSPWLLAGISGTVAVGAAVGSRRLFGAYFSRR